ncbi:unnamed protein product [Withania somnifera]
MRNFHLERHIISTCSILHKFKCGYVDEHFIELQDDATPNFVEEVVTLEEHPLDFAKLDNYMHQFKGSSSSIGAKKVKTECTQFTEYCRAGNGEGCKKTFQQLKREYAVLKKKLEVYFQYARQAGPTETSSCPPK